MPMLSVSAKSRSVHAITFRFMQAFSMNFLPVALFLGAILMAQSNDSIRVEPGKQLPQSLMVHVDGKPAVGADYANYPLVVLSQGEKKQVVRITADAQGHYRAALPPGDYILDAEGRVRRRLHVRAQPFTILPNGTVHVDITIDAGFAAEASTPQE